MDNTALIMECAKKLFYAKGYDAVGVQEIVNQAGITKPTLYYYFGSKLGLLKTLVETKVEELQMVEKSIMEDNHGIRDILYRMANALCQFFDRDREFYMVLIALFYSAKENEAHQVVYPYIHEYYQIVVSAFDQAAAELGNMHGRQEQFAIGFVGTMNHYLILHCERDPDHKENITENQVYQLVNQFMYGIFT